MGRLDFLAIRIDVWSAAKAKPYKGYDTAAAILIRPFGKIYSPPAQIEHELFALIDRGQRNRDSTAEAGVIPYPVIDSAFLQRYQRIRFCLS